MGQPYSFSFFDSVLAEAAGVSHYSLHVDPEAMVRAADAVVPLCKRLGVPAPVPHLAGFSYCHVSVLGCEILNGEGYLEPKPVPCLKGPEDIDRLREPDDYLAAGVVPERLEMARRLQALRPDASGHIGHDFEGPITTAVLMMGPDFFMLPHDDPARAHKLLAFATRSILNYNRVLRAHQGRPFTKDSQGMPDDFAGIFGPEQFKEFVVPYWAQVYEGFGAPRRDLHSELLREEHMPFLEELKIDCFDPSVDPHLPAEKCARSCRVPYGLRIWPATFRDLPADQLVAYYRHLASFHSQYVAFAMERLSDEPKAAAVLAAARELE